MIRVMFYGRDEIPDRELKYAVIDALYNDRWIFCRHRERNTWEIPGGHREAGECISDTAARELQEETGAVRFTLEPVCVYGVERDGISSYGMLYFSAVTEIGELPVLSEMAETMSSESLPYSLTYPEIQPLLHQRIQNTVFRDIKPYIGDNTG